MWVRRWAHHRSTRSIETTSHTVRWLGGFAQYEAQLKEYGVRFGEVPLPESSDDQRYDEDRLIQTIRSFISHLKSSGQSMSDIYNRAADSGCDHLLRDVIFLEIVEGVLERWNESLIEEDAVDYEDMLLLAAEHLESQDVPCSRRLVLVDEVQDCTLVMGRLINALAGHPDSRVFLVGDDWQSIYRFGGANIELMTDPGKHFGHYTRLDLTSSFRCPQQLCDIAGDFVQRDPEQLKKTVNSENSRESDSVVLVLLDDKKLQTKALAGDIEQLASRLGRNEPNALPSVVVLGRYKNDKPSNYLDLVGRLEGQATVEYSTIHSYKGREADYVFVVSVFEGYRGFPSLVESDPILNLVLPGEEGFANAEERRLFYVALTRARKMAVVYSAANQLSPFASELMDHEATLLLRYPRTRKTRAACEGCGNGEKIRRAGRHGEFWGCSRFPHCRYSTKLTR